MKLSRRKMLAATAGGIVTAASAGYAQNGAVPQPRRTGRGGTDPGPRNPSEITRTPTSSFHRRPIRERCLGHYIENTGSQPLRFLEMFKSSYYADVSLDQWIALTPPELVQAHLRIDRQTIDALRKGKKPIVPA